MTATTPIHRPSAKVLVLDGRNRLLLLEGFNPSIGRDQPFWFPVGGGLEHGESPRDAAVRELAEEIGLGVEAARLEGPVWSRRELFEFDGQWLDSDETFFVLRVPSHDVDFAGHTPSERRTILGHRWWSLDQLCATGQAVYPTVTAELLPELLSGPWTGPPRTVGD